MTARFKQSIARCANGDGSVEKANTRTLKKKVATAKDLAASFVVAVVALVAAIYFDIFESFGAWAQQYERWQIDELVVVSFVLALVVGARWWRRRKELEREIAKRERTEKALRESETHSSAVVTNAPVVLFMLDREGVFTLAEGKGLETLGLEPGEVVGLSIFEVYRDMPQVLKDVRRALAGEAFSTATEVAKSTFEVRYSPLREEDGGVIGIVGVATDITERKNLERRLRHQAFHDSLTDLPNRALFVDRLGHALDRAGRRRGRVAVLFMDLDNFKSVNDSLGHAVGDQLIVAVSERIKRSIRPSDTLARLGGDEFTILLEDLEEPEEEAVRSAERAVERVLQELSLPLDLNGYEFSVTTSVGIALSLPGGDDDHESLLRAADIAMYRAKEAGKNCYAVFSPEMGERSVRCLNLKSELRRAMQNPAEEFAVYYQPKVSVSAGRIVGFEALVRWQHPEHGLMLPAEFVPLAEETDLIAPLDHWALREACYQAGEWRERCPGDPLTMSINLSAARFRHPDFVREVSEVVEEAELDSGGLILEANENVVLEDAELATRKLE